MLNFQRTLGYLKEGKTSIGQPQNLNLLIVTMLLCKLLFVYFYYYFNIKYFGLNTKFFDTIDVQLTTD